MAAEHPLAARFDGVELLDALVTSVFLLDSGLCVCYLNSAAQTLIGLGSNQVLGRRLADV
ncbi:MAG: PAS domain-containing protein, partial [Proteobacteria bacterium]|nr:PAS domain-containing protein [Pseudomonadota bacterium]